MIKFNIFKIIPLFVVFSALSKEPIRHQRNKKLLVLIITSDQFPIYVELQKIWKSYMHYNPNQVEAYFIRGNEHLSRTFEVQGDIIWSKTDEGWSPQSAGIINKTILSMEAMMPRIDEFDYVLRTNLSSFYAFPRLLKFLETLPTTNCYCGSSIGDNSPIASGCGFIMSTDLAKMLVTNKHKLINKKMSPDDVLIGEFFNKNGIKLIPHARLDLLNLNDWEKYKNNIPTDIFQFRIKGDDALRLKNDIYIHSQLLKVFYN